MPDENQAGPDIAADIGATEAAPRPGGEEGHQEGRRQEDAGQEDRQEGRRAGARPAASRAPTRPRPRRRAKKAAAKKAPAKKAAAKKAAAPDEAPAAAAEAPAPRRAALPGARGDQEGARTPDPQDQRRPSEPAEPAEAPADEAAARTPRSRPRSRREEVHGQEDRRQEGREQGRREPTTEAQRRVRRRPVRRPGRRRGRRRRRDGDGRRRRRRRRRGGRRRRKPARASRRTATRRESDDDESRTTSDQADDAEPRATSPAVRAPRAAAAAAAAPATTAAAARDDPENTVTRVRRQPRPPRTRSPRSPARPASRPRSSAAARAARPAAAARRSSARPSSWPAASRSTGSWSIRQRDDLTQIGVLEDKVLVEHYVARESQTSLIGNVYLGRVQNVLPSMEAAFIDIGKGRNAVLYAGEVNWSSLGHKDGQPRKIESVLSSGQSILVQVTKDPIGHKGARLTSQISLAGRFLVYVPDGTTSGISRKLPDTERNRLKTLLKEIVPDTAGVIVRTAAEGASEEELTRDVERLKARWEDIEEQGQGQRPAAAVRRAGPDPQGGPRPVHRGLRQARHPGRRRLGDRAGLRRSTWHPTSRSASSVRPARRTDGKADVFATYRIDEQIAKGLDRKVWLPSGGSLIIDRTEAMTVIDVNTGKFTGSGGNLEETVTKNNLEAAEEVVRQLRLRDIGGIIVVDFIDMVLESNRDLVLRRLVECLGRDRTRHQVAEVTSLGLVQMTRKRIGTGLLEAFSENCAHCQGRGVVIHDHPVEPKGGEDESRRRGGGGGGGGGGAESSGGGGRRSRGGRGRGQDGRTPAATTAASKPAPSPKDVAAMAREHAGEPDEARRRDRRRSRRRSRSTEADEPVVEASRAAGRGARGHRGRRRRLPRRPRSSPGPRRRSSSRPAGQPTAAEPVADAEPAPEPAARAGRRAGGRGAQRAGAAQGRHPHPRPQREPPAGPPAGPAAGRRVTRAGGRRAGPVEPGTTEDARSRARRRRQPVEHVPIKREGLAQALSLPARRSGARFAVEAPGPYY